MINIYEVLETNKMIEQENLDVRTITMGISLLDCADTDVDRLCRHIYDKITRLAARLVHIEPLHRPEPYVFLGEARAVLGAYHVGNHALDLRTVELLPPHPGHRLVVMHERGRQLT